jgi:hypothetical protein
MAAKKTKKTGAKPNKPKGKAPKPAPIQSKAKAAPPAKAKKTPAPAPAPREEPFKPMFFQVLDNGLFELSFPCDQFDEMGASDVFQDAGLDGGGYDWEAVLAPALAARDEEASGTIEWSPEADSLVAISPDRSALEVLAEVIRAVTSSEKALAAAVRAHDPDRL